MIEEYAPLALVFFCGLLTLGYFEGKVALLSLATVAFLCVTSWALLFLGDVYLAVLIATCLVVVIGVASKTKYAYLRQTLVISDVGGLIVPNFAFLARQYRRRVVGLAIALLALLLAAIVAGALLPRLPVALPVRAALAAAATTVFAVIDRRRRRTLGQRAEVWELEEDRRHFSFFARSLLRSPRATRRLAFRDIADEPLSFDAPPVIRPGDSIALPDIVLILHESTFNPETYGFALTSDLEEFFSPEAGLGGPLHVDVFGGRTWQSEFSVLTGLSSLSFGNAAQYIFHLAPGRIRHSLPLYLRTLGYRTRMLATGDPRTLNMPQFYRAMGFDQVVFVEDVAASEKERSSRSDAFIYDIALRTWAEASKADSGPVLLAVSTIANHGPHRPPPAGKGRHPAARAFALAESGSGEYAEYFARLVESGIAYRRFRNAAAEAVGHRPAVFARYGDHQPTFAASLADRLSGEARLYETFYVIEASGLRLAPRVPLKAPLDSAFLATATLLAAGVPLDPFYATHASLIAECGAGYFASASERKRRFHRSLVDQGLVAEGVVTPKAGAAAAPANAAPG